MVVKKRIIKDEGVIKYIGKSEMKRFDEMFEVEREDRNERIKESRFRRMWKI